MALGLKAQQPSKEAVVRPTRLSTLIVALSLFSLGLAVTGCGSSAAPRGLPSASSSATATTPTPSPTVPQPTATVPQPKPTSESPSPTAPSSEWTVVSTKVSVPWTDVSGARLPMDVRHAYGKPPVANLVAIGAADHLNNAGARPYSRMSFSFTARFPTYRFNFEPYWTNESGQEFKLDGGILLVIVFLPAQAHTPTGHSTVVSQPPSQLGLSRMVNYVKVDDSEGYLAYVIGVPWTPPDDVTPPGHPVRVYEVTYVNGLGEYRYVVAIDIDAR
jgi:hypothetical protein